MSRCSRRVTKFSGRIETPAQLANLTRHAFRIATSGTPGPVHLDVAGNVGSVTDYWETDEPVFVGSPRTRRFPRIGRGRIRTCWRSLRKALQGAEAAGRGDRRRRLLVGRASGTGRSWPGRSNCP